MRKTEVKEVIRLETREVWPDRVTDWINVETIDKLFGARLAYAMSLASQGRIAEAMREADFVSNTPSVRCSVIHQFRCVVISEVIYGDPAYPAAKSTASEGKQ